MKMKEMKLKEMRNAHDGNKSMKRLAASLNLLLGCVRMRKLRRVYASIKKPRPSYISRTHSSPLKTRVRKTVTARVTAARRVINNEQWPSRNIIWSEGLASWI